MVLWAICPTITSNRAAAPASDLNGFMAQAGRGKHGIKALNHLISYELFNFTVFRAF
jgi:hypothetical protein